ncbi:unnamed protein product [Mytilus coruscus]|uniref:PiggyBac transposable element-derived protein domain-containing protein n=1 Tax=Mytilus coruscus TaxID=42192 RepID=A0A6J8AYP2_MYTCO|nr:unnamed protein product [Mytilus coruscus]
MADEWASFFESDDEDEEFEGFSQSDIDESDIRSIGSDICLSELESESSEDEEPELNNEIWTINLYKPPVTEFSQPFGAAFNLEKEKKAIDFFHKFFPFALVEKLVEETNSYARKCILTKPDKVWVETTALEMMAFLGIHVVCSVLGVPNYALAWKKQ